MAKTAIVVPLFQDLTTEEQKLFVNVNTESAFTQSNCDTYIRLRNIEAYPRVFGSLAVEGFRNKHIGAYLINIDKIEDGNKYYEQLARFSVNPEESSIEEDITTNQFSLAELGIMVMRHPKKKGWYIILEGRTRFRILRKLGMTNIIAELFDTGSDADMLRFATAMNAQKKPFGKASWTDIQKTILQLIDMGAIKGPNFTDAISYELGIITTRLPPMQVKLIIYAGIKRGTGITPVISFPGGTGAEAWLIENGYIDTRELMYVPVSAFIEKVHARMLTMIGKYPHKEIRFVLHCGVPDAKDPEGYWKKSVRNFGKKFKEYERNLSNARFGGAEVVEGNYKIYGGIPQIRSLETKHPMDKLVVY